MSTRTVAAWLLFCVVHVVPASAQDSLGQALSFLLTNQAVQTGDFVKDAEAARVTSETISRLVLIELTTQPLSSSAAGFAYEFNPALGTLERASDSFGPFFTERAATSGRGRLSMGVAVQVAQFERIDGQDLEDGSFITSGNQFRDEPAPFDIEALTLDLESRSVTLFGSVGVTDRLDVGVAVPFISLSLEGRRVNTYRGEALLQATADASASGLGDAALRAKFRLFGAQASGVAVLGEARLPTGREEDLLGAGSASYSTFLIGSFESRALSAHGNVGLTTGGLADIFSYRGAIGISATPRLTLVGELLGRTLRDVGRIVEERVPHPTIVGVDTLRRVATDGDVSVIAAVAGLKWNIASTWLLGAHVTFPLTDRGLRPGLVPVVTLDYTVAR